jgi:hypothetical protein
MYEIRKDRTCMDHDRLVDCIGDGGGDNLFSKVRIRQADNSSSNVRWPSCRDHPCRCNAESNRRPGNTTLLGKQVSEKRR